VTYCACGSCHGGNAKYPGPRPAGLEPVFPFFLLPPACVCASCSRGKEAVATTSNGAANQMLMSPAVARQPQCSIDSGALSAGSPWVLALPRYQAGARPAFVRVCHRARVGVPWRLMFSRAQPTKRHPSRRKQSIKANPLCALPTPPRNLPPRRLDPSVARCSILGPTLDSILVNPGADDDQGRMVRGGYFSNQGHGEAGAYGGPNRPGQRRVIAIGHRERFNLTSLCFRRRVTLPSAMTIATTETRRAPPKTARPFADPLI